MLMKAGQRDNLVDLQGVQGYRLREADYWAAYADDRTDPFPHGAVRVGNGGSVSSEAVDDLPSLVAGFLRSIEGGLPDYILEELFRSLHVDERGLYDFLGLFDKRLSALSHRVDAEGILVSEEDDSRDTPRLTDRMLRYLGGDARRDFLQLLPALSVRSHNLQTLKRAVEWWAGRRVWVYTRFDILRPLNGEAKTRVGAHPDSAQNNALGRGAILGKSGLPPHGRIEIDLACRDAADLKKLSCDTELLSGLHTLLERFFREKTSRAVFAVLKRKHIAPPRLSANPAGASKLGAYNCLCPQLRPQASTRIKLNLRSRASEGAGEGL